MKKHNYWIIFALSLGGLGLLLMILILAWVLTDNSIFSLTPPSIDLKKANNIGGFIGGLIGVFWSAAGAILIFATFREQKKLAEKQQFENTFFQMLSTLHNMMNTTSGKVKMYSSKDRNGGWVTGINGREFFYEFLNSFKSVKYSSDFKANWRQNNYGNMTERVDQKKTYTRDFITKSYIYAYRNNQAELGYLFRLIFNIIKYAINERKKHNDEEQYINLIQAQLSSDILAILFYNALTPYSYTNSGQPKFHTWLDTYQVFENIDSDSLLSYYDYRFYPKTKFKYNGSS